MTKTRTPYQVVDEIAQMKIGSDIDLSSGIQAKIRKDNRLKMNTKRFITGAVAAMLVMVVLIVSIPGVAQAVRQLFGFVPGIGIVEQSGSLRILKEPVQSKQGETTVSIQQAMIDSEHTDVLYQVENITAEAVAQFNQLQDRCHELPWLQLSDGTQLTGVSVAGDSWFSGYSRHMEFPALPASEYSAALVFSCLENTRVDAYPKRWEIPLEFVAVPPETTVFPIVDISPSNDAAEAVFGEDSSQDSVWGSQISLTLNEYIQTNENIILFGALNTNSADFGVQYIDSDAIHLEDVDGNAIPLVEDSSLSDSHMVKTNEQSLSLTYRSDGRYNPGPASLTIDNAWIGLNDTASFLFDPGENPQPGQKWDLNQSLNIAGYVILVKNVTLSDSGDGLSFTIEKPDDVSEFSLMDFDHPLLPGGGTGSYGFTYRDGFPTGVINVTLTALSVKVEGPWKTTIDLPAFTDGVVPTQTPQACFTQSSWQSALQESISTLPSGLSGTLVLNDTLEPEFLYHVLTSDLNGENQIDRGLGREGSMSPDKQTLIYSTSDGLKLLDLTTGQIDAVPDTSKRDGGAVWSPDGTMIAFTRGPASGLIGGPGPYSLILIDADGSNQRVLLENADANIIQAWLPDGKSILYTVKGPDGATVYQIDITTGLLNKVFDLNYLNANVAISPDGQHLAFEQMLPGERYSVWISDLDGSNQRLVVDASPVVVTRPYWSPDGQWLIMSVTDISVDENHPTLALLQPDTCQIVPLTSLKGFVTSWRE